MKNRILRSTLVASAMLLAGMMVVAEAASVVLEDDSLAGLLDLLPPVGEDRRLGEAGGEDVC